MSFLLLAGLLAAAIRVAMSIALAAIGETLAQRSGVLNVGIEGIMLVGAFLAAFGAAMSGSPWLGLALAVAVGIALAALHGYFAITLRADQVVSGIALILLGLGLSGFLFRISLGRAPTPIPAFEPLLLGQSVLVYLGIAIAVAAAFVLKRTALGLRIRACGENPAAALAAGVPVNAIRYGCVLFGGGMAGFGGAYLSLAQVNAFVENMVAGRGFIAIACVVFGRWHPVKVLVVAFCFGLAEAAQIRLQTFYPGVPYQFFVMLPYLVAVIALVAYARSAGLPRALGKPLPDEM